MGRVVPRVSVPLGRIQAISEEKGPLSNCQKAMLSLEKECSYENTNSHSLTAPPTCQFQNSIVPYSPRFTPTQPTYRSQRISLHHNYGACTTPHSAPTRPYPQPPHPSLPRPAPHAPHAPHPTHTYPLLTHPTQPIEQLVVMFFLLSFV